jgi:hypothetical protein
MLIKTKEMEMKCCWLLKVVYWMFVGIMFIAAAICILDQWNESFGSELTYEMINCDINGVTMIITVPMGADWTWEQKEVVAEKICESIHEYQDQEDTLKWDK